MATASDPAKTQVFILFRADRLPPADLSFHRVPDCPAVVAGRAEADELVRQGESRGEESVAMLLFRAGGDNSVRGYGYRTLGPLSDARHGARPYESPIH